MKSLVAGSLVVAVALALLGCAPLAPEPDVRGPNDTREHVGESSAMRELVWVRPGRTVRITRGAHMCQKDQASASCVRLSSADLKELDRFFGTSAFRERWSRFRACPTRVPTDPEIVVVTFADGERVAKLLDAQMGTPLARECDRYVHDAVATIGDELVKRYFY